MSQSPTHDRRSGRAPIRLLLLALAGAASACESPGEPGDLAPEVTIVAPAADSTAYTRTILVEGTATDDARVEAVGYTVNGGEPRSIAITPGRSVSFSDSVTLPAADNRIELFATDAAGNRSTAEVRVPLVEDTVPPQISWSGGLPTFTMADRLVLNVHAFDDAGVVSLTYRVGDAASVAIPIVPGKFVSATITIALPLGATRITLEAVDRAGRRRTWTHELSRVGRLDVLRAGYYGFCGLAGEVVFCSTSQSWDSRPWYATAPERVTTLSMSGGGWPCALGESGRVYCWKGTSQAIPLPGNVAFRSISGGARYGCGLTGAGAAYCWGENTYGQLGDGTRTASTTPVPVAGGLTFRTIDTGDEHSCAVTERGEGYCWGADFGPLPRRVAEGISLASVAAGHGGVDFAVNLSCGIATDGTGYCWSGTGPAAPIAGGLRFLSLGLAHTHWCGIAEGNVAYCWGSNRSGQLGTGHHVDGKEPLRVAGDHRFVSISAASGGSFKYATTCALTATGEGYCWGNLSSSRYVNTPFRILDGS